MKSHVPRRREFWSLAAVCMTFYSFVPDDEQMFWNVNPKVNFTWWRRRWNAESLLATH